MSPSQLRSRRIHLGISRSDLAREMGLSPQIVAEWETGDREIDSPHLLDAALRSFASRASAPDRAESRDRV